MDEAGEPETRYLRRESVTLAFLVALQSLPARQRAVLLLRDVGSATEELLQLQELCKNQVNELRSFVRSMRPVDVEGSLNATLRRVVEQFQKDSGIPSSFVSAEFLEPSEPEISLEEGLARTYAWIEDQLVEQGVHEEIETLQAT